MKQSTNTSAPISKAVSAGIVALALAISVVTIILTLAMDVSVIFGKAVDFYDIPLDLHDLLEPNFLSVVGLYFILSVKDAAQHI